MRHRNAVYDDERVIGSIEGCRAPDTDRPARSRAASAGDNLDTGHLSFEQVIG